MASRSAQSSSASPKAASTAAAARPSPRMRRQAGRRKPGACVDAGSVGTAREGRPGPSLVGAAALALVSAGPALRGGPAVPLQVAIPASAASGSMARVATRMMAPPGKVPQSLAVTSAASSSPCRSTSRRSPAARTAKYRVSPSSSAKVAARRLRGRDRHRSWRVARDRLLRPARAEPCLQPGEIEQMQAEVALGRRSALRRRPGIRSIRSARPAWLDSFRADAIEPEHLLTAHCGVGEHRCACPLPGRAASSASPRAEASSPMVSIELTAMPRPAGPVRFTRRR